VNYAMVISTNSGLWRYVIGDTVEFTGTAPYRIKITGRTKQFINAFGEEVTVNNTDKALAETCIETEAEVCDYTVAPIYPTIDGPGRHEWAIEFTKAPGDLPRFAARLDRKLQLLNSDYQAKRSGDLVMSNLSIIALRPGTFYLWLQSKGKAGSQHKIPRLRTDCKLLHEIKDISDHIT
ncbi:MAG: auxin-responsive promoter, partial [Bacteroidetes bacterium]|nr:auxin-responsive promoter [Bacteroidota bacterium]